MREFLGTTKILLAWIVRKTRDPLPNAEDPDDGYVNQAEELIARAPHFDGADPPVLTRVYKDNDIRVFNILSQIFRERECWTHVQHASRSRDGRSAHCGLKDHYLGPNNVDNLANSAKQKLQNNTYSGEQR